MEFIWLAAGAACAAYSVITLLTQPFHLGLLVPAGVGSLAVLLGLAPAGSLLQSVCAILLLLFAAGFSLLILLLGLGSRPSPIPDAGPRWILVPGYALYKGQMTGILQRRLDTAILLLQEHPESRILVTGGAPRKGPAEAQRMREYLLSRGIEDSRIMIEEKSASSYQNLLHCKALWEASGKPSVCLVTSSFHMLRMRMTAKHLHFPMDFIPAPVPCGLLAVEAAREGILLVKTALFGYASMAWANGRL